MIAIVNLGPVGKADPLGRHRYEVRINRAPVCRFEHTRARGLEDCLRRAADAVAAKETKQMMKLISHEVP